MSEQPRPEDFDALIAAGIAEAEQRGPRPDAGGADETAAADGPPEPVPSGGAAPDAEAAESEAPNGAVPGAPAPGAPVPGAPVPGAPLPGAPVPDAGASEADRSEPDAALGLHGELDDEVEVLEEQDASDVPLDADDVPLVDDLDTTTATGDADAPAPAGSEPEQGLGADEADAPAAAGSEPEPVTSADARSAPPALASDTGAAFEVDAATVAAALPPFEPAPRPGAASAAPPPLGWSLSRELEDDVHPPTEQFDAVVQHPGATEHDGTAPGEPDSTTAARSPRAEHDADPGADQRAEDGADHGSPRLDEPDDADWGAFARGDTAGWPVTDASGSAALAGLAERDSVHPHEPQATTHAPPAGWMPPVQPPVRQTPMQQPPVHQTPVQQPPVQQPPMPHAPTQQPPVHEPPVHEPPVQHAPAGQPTGHAQQWTQPPGMPSPEMQPLGMQPAATQPPLQQPSRQQPSLQQPPVGQPPLQPPGGASPAVPASRLPAPATEDPLALAAIRRVHAWLAAPRSGSRNRAAERLATMLGDADGRDFAMAFVDRVLRPEDAAVSARNLEALSRDIPGFVDWYLKLGVTLGGGFGVLAPKLVIPAARRAMRDMVSTLVVDAGPRKLGKTFERLRRGGSKLEVAPLGPTVLGRSEASRRVEATVALLERDDVDAASITVAALAPRRQLWAFGETVEYVVEQLLPIARAAAAASPPKQLMLDIETHRDLDLTVAVLERLLSSAEFARLVGGVVLPASMPESLAALNRLSEFARARTRAGGVGVAVRIVAGPNRAMEAVDAALRGWPLAVLDSREATDANIARLLRAALRADAPGIARVAVTGDDLWSLAYAEELARAAGTLERLDVTMPLGVAPEQVELVRTALPVTRWAPVVPPEQVDAAVGYLVQVLEERASELRIPSLDELDEVEVLLRERDRFVAAIERMRAEDRAGAPQPLRTQDRGGDLGAVVTQTHEQSEPVTDPSLAANRDWARTIVERASSTQVGDRILGRNLVLDAPTLDRRLERTASAAAAWAARGSDERARILREAAVTLGVSRGRLVEALAGETGTTFAEADAEVSAAVDAARHAADRAIALDEVQDARPVPVPLTVVRPAATEPLATGAADVTAALASGSAVALLPTAHGKRVAAVLVEALWEAGVPREVLVLCDMAEDALVERALTHPLAARVLVHDTLDAVGTLAEARQDGALLGDVAGVNAMIVTPAADLDLAAADLVASAFLHAGQQRTAVRVAILVGSVGESERFGRQLVDAASALRVGASLDLRTDIGPLVEPASGSLLHALTSLEEGETWLLEPMRHDAEGRFWSPGIRVGGTPEALARRASLAAPLLSLIAVGSLDQALALQRQLGATLVAGIHSLDAGEVSRWLKEVDAGTLVINRATGGSRPGRAPLCAWERSTVGAGTSIGGPDALVPLVDWEPLATPPREHVKLVGLDRRVSDLIESATPQLDFLEFDRVRTAANSDQRAWARAFGGTLETVTNLAERTVLRWRPVGVLVRIAEDGTAGQLVRLLAAAARARAAVRLSSAIEIPPGILALARKPLPPLEIVEHVVESDAEFRERIATGAGLGVVRREDALGFEQVSEPVHRIRLAGTDESLRQVIAGRPDVAVYDGPVSVEGSIELLPFLREQRITMTAHRFGIPDPGMLAIEL